MSLNFSQGWITDCEHVPSPHYNLRPDSEVSLLVIHNISLPAGCFGTPYIDQLFQGCLDIAADESFQGLKGLEVSSHFLIRRSGKLVQYVSCDDRAWHAGVSSYQGRDGCNDFAVGVELEGTDNSGYTQAQYQTLIELTQTLFAQYPKLSKDTITGHSDIAPGRKTDPGPSFDWQGYLQALS